MKIFATKVCLKGILALFNGTRGKCGGGNGNCVEAPNGALSSSSGSESVSVRIGSDDWEEASLSLVSSLSSCLCTYVTTRQFQNNSGLSSSNFSKLFAQKSVHF